MILLKFDVKQPKVDHGNSGKTAVLGEADKNYLIKWFEKLPTLPSHYCRSTPANQEKKFPEPGTTLNQLHRDYKQAAEDDGSGQKDQCDTCISAKHGNIDQESYQAHIRAKGEARAEKAKDKETASAKKSVWTLDVQAVLLCPKTKASALYYKTKLQLHNLSFYNLKSGEGYCYVWDETQGDYKHFSEVLDAHPEIEEIVIWSDGFTYQNRNTNLANSLLDLAIKCGVKIVQKYLVVGHTQMEVDSKHATIERKLVGDIYIPHDYVVVMESARLKPSPHVVKQVSHDEVMKLDGSYLSSIRPGKKTGDPTVYNLWALEFQSTGTVQFKLEISEKAIWEKLRQRISLPKKPFSQIRHFKEQLPIKERKYNNLQSMKPVLPTWAHPFYDNLPHHNN
ncbi:Hypothetical predicted protein [Paramuricea clavata]|uniref:Uncharacterized protein n=1 Tax=Paramuricea clavata TaxID=317549 RepID=A0A7D9HL24_PARCT|nr:Hypothetical predicted protein [Paramuricea clavata]